MRCTETFNNFFVKRTVEVVKFGVFRRRLVVYIEKLYSGARLLLFASWPLFKQQHNAFTVRIEEKGQSGCGIKKMLLN